MTLFVLNTFLFCGNPAFLAFLVGYESAWKERGTVQMEALEDESETMGDM